MDAIRFKTKTSEGLPAAHYVMIDDINAEKTVRIVTRMFVISDEGRTKVLRKFFGKYYIQRESLFYLSTFIEIVDCVNQLIKTK